MRIHKEGYRIILLLTVLTFAVIAVILKYFQIALWLEFLLYLSGAVFLLCTVLFFRVPTRNAGYTDQKVFSGADGKVVVIEEVFEEEVFKDKRLQVSVFMSVTDVHVNFFPVSGVVTYHKYHPGKYFFAWLPKASLENERTTLVIKNSVYGPVLVRQIAGAFARRIVCHPKEGDQVNQGSEMGIIKFGSRVDIFLPLEAQIKVELNQQVRGGETVIAQISRPVLTNH